METVIYLVKHAEELEEKGVKNVDDSSQICNEKYVLSVKGEIQARKLSKNSEMQNIDILWCSSYARAKCTAKYIAYQNGIDINIDSKLNERKLGSLDDLSKWMKDKPYGVVQSYLLDRTYKGKDGESCEEATERIVEFIKFILKEFKGKRIALVSHGALISFLLARWCKLDNQARLIWKDDVVEVKEPSITKLIFNDEVLDNIISVKIDAN